MGARDRAAGGRAPLVGPLFAWELLRLARRGQTVRARTLLLVVLLATYAVFGLVWFWKQPLRDWLIGGATLDINDSALFADTFVLTILLAQMAVVCVLAPAYGAGVIAEEKERRSLGLLLTTQLTEREVVVGKFLGRVVLLVSVLVAGLPMIMLVHLSGGVDVVFVLAGYAVTATTAVLLAAVGMLVGVGARGVRTALYRAYGFTVVYVLLGFQASPHGFLLLLYGMRVGAFPYEEATALYAGLQLAVSLVLVWMAVREVRWLRTGSRSGTPKPPRARRPRRREVARAVHRLDPDRDDAHEPVRRADRPRIRDSDPLWWKERYVTGFVESREEREYRKAKGYGVAVAWAAVGVLFLVGIAVNAARGSDSGVPVGVWVSGGAVAAGAWLLGAGVVAAGSLCRERQRQTLDSLLSLPVDRGAIVWAKWRAAVVRGWPAGVVAAVLGLLGFAPALAAAAPAVALLGVAAMLAVPVAGFVLVVSAAVWLSGRCATTNRAVLLLMPVLAGVVFGPWVWWEVVENAAAFAVGLLAAAAVMAAAAAWLYRAAVRELTGGVP